MSQTYRQVAPATSLTRTVLFATWAALSLAALAFVLTLGTNAPYADEWEFVPALTGHERVLPWLWQLHNEHRLPFPRAVFLALFRLTHDFRSGMVLQVIMLSGLSLGLIRLAEHLRGRPHWADVFFPASLLHAGHWENLLMGYQLCFVLFTVLVTLLGVVAMRTTPENAFRSGVGAGLLLLLLALCGLFGLVVIPPVVVWLLYLAAVVRRGEPRWKAAVLVGLAAVSVGYLALYFVGYHRPAHHPPPGEGGIAIALVAGQTLAMAPGISLAAVWPAVFAGMLGLGAATLGVLVRSGRDPANRPAVVGLIAVAAGVVGLALAIGIGRAGLGDDRGLWSRYSLLMWPLLGLAYLVWVRHGRKWVPVGLCAVAALAFTPNMLTGMLIGAKHRELQSTVVVESALGVPPEVIVAHHLKDFGPPEWIIRGIPMLREARIGGFAGNEEPTPWWAAIEVVVAVLAGFAGRWLWHLGRAVQVERARELFRLQHERFEQMLLSAAAQTGKPRGLTWVGCEIAGDAILARDRQTRGIVAFVPVVVRFEPVAGSDMEEVPAAREPRPATAVFTFEKGHWRTDGRVVFNHTPEQAVAAFGGQFAVLGQHH
jgi:hypothetical protein